LPAPPPVPAFLFASALVFVSDPAHVSGSASFVFIVPVAAATVTADTPA
jgi:hypothetical protein